MKIETQTINLNSSKQFEVINITEKVEHFINSCRVLNGMVNVFVPHTTASIRLNHDEPLLLQDIMKMLYRTAPVDINYSHDLFEIRSGVEVEERSNGHAHVKSFLLGASETIPLQNGNLILGDRQSIFFVEFDGGRKRHVVIQVMGE